MTLRTQDEIATRFEAIKPTDSLGFGRAALAEFMDYAHAKPFLQPEVTKAEWDGDATPLTRESVLEVMRDYMTFAWDKALGERGISANRSVDKFREWVWILGDQENLDAFERAEYAPYGKPKLKVLCQAYGFPVPEEVDDV